MSGPKLSIEQQRDIIFDADFNDEDINSFGEEDKDHEAIFDDEEDIEEEIKRLI